jgi:uroporphyrinogen decarboxylase
MFSLDYIAHIVATLRNDGVPVIVFSKGAHHALKELADIGADVIGLDWTVDLHDVRNLIGEKVALQGNFDPSFLYASPERIRGEVMSLLQKYGRGSGHVFNLGHGILPDVQVDNARAFVRAVKEKSPVYHA